jgi:hypothetical protein
MARVPWALLLLVGACHAQFVAQVHIEPTVDPTSVYAAIQTFSGPAEQGVNPSGHADGPGQGARYYEPAGVAAAGIDGTVYVADVRNHVIRKVYWTGWAETYAGLAGRYGLADGTGEAARFHNPSAVSVGPDGEVYVADTGNHAVRVVSATRLVTTLFAARSYATAEARMGAGVPMGLWNPGGVVAWPNAAGTLRLVVADTDNHRLLWLSPKGTTPSFAEGGGGGTALASSSSGGEVGTDAAAGGAATGSRRAMRQLQSAANSSGASGGGAAAGGDAGAAAPPPSPAAAAATPTAASPDGASGGGTTGSAAGGTSGAGNGGGSGGSSAAAAASITPRSEQWTLSYFAGVQPTAGFADGDAFGRPQTDAFGRPVPHGALFRFPHGLALCTTRRQAGSSARRGLQEAGDAGGGDNGTVASGGGAAEEAAAPPPDASTAASPPSESAFMPPPPPGAATATEYHVLVADTGNHAIRTIRLHRESGTVQVHTLAGTGYPGRDDSRTRREKPKASVLLTSILNATFAMPTAVACGDADGGALVADTANHRIRQVRSDGVTVTVAGGDTSGMADGDGPFALLNRPSGITVDESKTRFIVVDSRNSALRNMYLNSEALKLLSAAPRGRARGTGWRETAAAAAVSTLLAAALLHRPQQRRRAADAAAAAG